MNIGIFFNWIADVNYKKIDFELKLRRSLPVHNAFSMLKVLVSLKCLVSFLILQKARNTSMTSNNMPQTWCVHKWFSQLILNWIFVTWLMLPMVVSSEFNRLQFLYVDKTDVTNIFLESHFWTLITDYWQFSCFFKTCDSFQTSWNFIPFHMYNEIRTKFQHFCLIEECWN